MERIVSLSKGVMEPLLGKLANLTEDEYSRMSVVPQRVSFLKHELCAMNAVLDKMDRMDELDPSAKDWMGQVRDMAYDTDDCVGDFMAQIGDINAEQGFVQKVTRYLRTLWARREIAVQLEELKARAVEVSERRLRYDDKGYTSSLVSDNTQLAIDPRLMALYQEAACLVGIDYQRKELVNLLMARENKLKVVSIVGLGGVGKTTLAKLVYDEIGGQFGCKVFVSVSQQPDLKSLLTGIHMQLGIEDVSHSCAINVLIDRIKEHLTSHRYIILIDDLWDRPAWDIIRCAFPENNKESRVIVTTRLEDVACWACCNYYNNIYRMQPLNNAEARMLFFNRVFGSEYDWTSHFELEKVTAEILKKCGGLPLAITAVASILATCPARLSDWMSFNNSMSLQFATNPSLEGVKHILNLSYKHLPQHLRPCLLYLGLYPEDCEVERDVLIHEWIAEGLVSAMHLGELGSEDVAKRYFNELVNRNLLQPVRTEQGEVVSCKVHDMMLDLILAKCVEDDFITVARNSGDMERLHHYKVRRLSLRLRDADTTLERIPGTISESLAHVRSLAWFRKSTYTPNLLQFKYLRVLIIDTGTGDTVDLAAIGALFQLRYLRVSTPDACIELPSKIRGLVNLETFYISGEKSPGIPSDIFLLRRLLHLMIPHGTKLPKGIGNMKALQTLYGFEFSLKDIASLAKLTNLRNLKLCHIANFDIGTAGVDVLVSSLEVLRNLKYLAVDGRIKKNGPLWIKDVNDRLCSLSNPPPHIEVLKLEYWMLYRIPNWIGSLLCLRQLTLHVKMMPADDVHLLGRLPSLVELHLFVVDIPTDRIVEVGAGLFAMLEILKIENEHGSCMTYLSFKAGSMPKLQQLYLVLPRGHWRGTAPVGMEHLLSLKGVYAIWNHNSEQDVREAKAAFNEVVGSHAGHPSFEIIFDTLVANAYLYASGSPLL